MKINEFINTIYLGDRCCKEICINGFDGIVSIKVDNISRIRSHDKYWNFYSDEDIENGLIVFTGVKTIYFLNSKQIPNDRINYMKFIKSEDNFSTFRISIDSIKEDASSEEVVLEIQATGIHLKDPSRPSIIIDN